MGDSRLFEMVYLLLEQEAVPASEFARRFEISVRTVYRDVDRLLAAGIPVVITRGRKGGLSLMNGFRLDRTALTREERQQILFCPSGHTGNGTGGDLRRAAETERLLRR